MKKSYGYTSRKGSTDSASKTLYLPSDSLANNFDTPSVGESIEATTKQDKDKDKGQQS